MITTMTRFHHYLMVAISVLLLTSCSKKDEPTTLSVSPSNLEFSSDANESKSVNISCNADWMVTDHPDWLEVSQYSGQGDGHLTLTTKTDNSDTNRSGMVTIKANDKQSQVSVSQKATLLNVSPNSIELLSDKGSSVSFSINTGSGTQWTISNTPQWLSLSASSGTGSGSVTITAINTNDSSQPRSAQLIVNAGGRSAIVDVMQRAAYMADCKVGFKDIVILDNSVAFKYDIY